MFQSKRPLVYLLTAVVGMSLVIQQQPMGGFIAFASESSARDSGYDHGCDDSGISDPGERYINQPEKGPSFHTNDFIQGYDEGFNACREGGGGFDQPGEIPSYNPPQPGEIPHYPTQPDFEQGSPGRDQTQEPYYPPNEERHYEGQDWWSICRSVDNLLSEPCETLVTPDGNALTAEGKRVLEKVLCIAGQPIVGLLQPELLPYAAVLCVM